jgi:magnesium transporter
MAGRRKRSTKIGMPPGALVHVGERKIDRAAISLIEFGPAGFAERSFSSIAESREFTPAEPVLWLNVHGLHEPEVMGEIGRRFNLHPLVIEDILNTEQRPKFDDYGVYLFFVARFFDYDPQAQTLASEQVSLVLGRGFLLTFQERPTGNFNPVRDRLRQDRGQIRHQGADYLAYALLDTVVDRYFVVLDELSERVERLEEELLEGNRPFVLEQLHHLKRQTVSLRRAVWPLREVINSLTRSAFFGAEVQPYLRDIYDHTVHIIESLEAVRDLVSNLQEIHLAAVSNRVNQEVRVLTVIAVIFMPSSLLAGIFGMNFRAMPLLEDPGGFAFVIGLMLCVAATLGLVFWRRKWLG